jgi:hypothetical protein
MKPPVAALAVAALSLAIGSRTQAQNVVYEGTWGRAPVLDAPVSYSSSYVPPYSYYAAYPFPARIYLPHGPNEFFPFYGRPYGSPSDPWSWAAMSTDRFGGLARYYYPPVR